MSGYQSVIDLGELAFTLPTADFDSECEDSCASTDEQVFSRSDYIKSLGDLHKVEYPSGQNLEPESCKVLEPDDVELIGGSKEVESTQHSEADLQHGHVIENKLPMSSFKEFKDEFSDALKEAEEKLASSLKEDTLTPYTNRDNIFIEMVTALHDSRCSLEDGKEPELNSQSDKISCFDDGGDTPGGFLHLCSSSLKLQTSPTKPRLTVSLSNLKAIQESDLDHSLESTENLELSQSYDAEDSDPFTESNSIFLPRHELAWGLKKNSGCNDDSSSGYDGIGTAQLMDQLHQLSMTQTHGYAEVSKAEMSGVASVTVSQHTRDIAAGGSERTVLGPHSADAVGNRQDSSTLPSAHSDRSESDSDEDDPYVWAVQRRRMKEALQQHRTPSHLFSPSSSSSTSSSTHHLHLIHTVTSPPPIITLKHRDHSPITALEHRVPPHSAILEHKVQPHATTLEHRVPPHTTTLEHRVPPHTATLKHMDILKHRSPPLSSVTQNSNKRSGTDGSQISPDKVISVTEEEEKVAQVVFGVSNRVRNSSFSEDGVPSSEYVHHSGNDDAQERSTKEKSLEKEKETMSLMGKKSKRKGRKSKKTTKKEQAQSSIQSTSKSQASKRRRAHILQRIRSDSLNTSSDEERQLSSTSSDSLLAGVVTSDSVFVDSPRTDSAKDDGNSLRDAGEVKKELKRRIISKKPPAYFETPGTDPIFHDDVSFSSRLVDHVLSGHSTGLLVLLMAGHGLISLPSPWSEKLPVDAHVTLQCLLLTWLVVQAAEDYYNISPTARQDSKDLQLNPLLFSTFPFRIAGLQQTVFEGNPSLLIAIQERSDKGDTDSAMAGNLFSKTVGAFLANVTLEKALEPLILQESIFTIITTLSSLSGLLRLPLTTFFTFHEDTSPLSTPISFYWHSSYHPSCLPSSESLMAQKNPTSTVCTICDSSLSDPTLVHSVFQQVLLNGLDIAGIRTVYGKPDCSLSCITSSQLDLPSSISDLHMTLAVALRGPNAIFHWMDLVGPQDGTLAKITDPFSLTAKFGSNRIHTLRTPFRSTAALAKWFGGRACLKTCSVFGMTDSYTKSERRKRQRVRFSETQSESEESVTSPFTDLGCLPLISNLPRLTIPAYTKFLLVISPNVPPICYGSVLASCSKLGFDIFGAKRIRLNLKRAAALEIHGEILSHFAPSSTPPSPLVLFESSSNPLVSGIFKQDLPPLPSVIFIIGRENSRIHCATLQRLITTNLRSLVENNLHVEISTRCLDDPFSLAHLGPYVEEKLKYFGSFSAPISQANLPSVESIDNQGLGSDKFSEELCFVAVPGPKSLLLGVGLLDRIFRISPFPELDSRLKFQGAPSSQSAHTEHEQSVCSYRDPELVGMKIIPQLSRFHSKKLCPLVPNDPLYCQAIQLLTDKPAMLFVFRGVSCHTMIRNRIKSLLTSSHVICLEQRVQYIVSRSPSDGIFLSCLFFSGKDLYSDPQNWPLPPYLPHNWVQESDILQGFIKPRENLFSIVQLPLSEMKLALNVLIKFSRSGFHFAGISAVGLSTRSEGVVEDFTNEEESVCEAGVVVCVEKVNAVWATEHVLQSFFQDELRVKFKWSRDFSSAISDLKLYFSDGIWTNEISTIIKDYNIKLLSRDVFSNLLLPDESLKHRNISSPLLRCSSPLKERMAILLFPALLSRSADDASCVASFIHVLGVLHQAQFEICGMKMVMLSDDSARELKIMFSLDVKLEDVTCSPCLSLVLEGTNAASCFHLIVKSVLQTHYSHANFIKRVFSDIVIPSNKKQVDQLLAFLQCS